MKNREQYAGIDWFRIAAALLVVTIHTSPLAGWSAEADFFFTRVLARVAVPYFFMVTGRFVLADYFWSEDFQAGRIGRLGRYLRKILILYAVSILIYLPVGIYAGHYEHLTVGEVCRMLLFDGTFYHLWYFPACIMGVGLVCLFVRLWKIKGAFVAAGALYLFGLFGDSYYGLAAECPPIALIYEKGFSLWSYTRNGLFMAPVFLLLGVSMASRKKTRRQMGRGQLIIGLLCSFALMTAEAFILRYFGLPRHDSMYVLLVPTVFFLYRLLEGASDGLPGTGQHIPRALRLIYSPRMLRILRLISTGIYILHPGMIVVVRGIAKFSGINSLVENGILHYFCVVLLTVAVVCPAAVLLEFLVKKRSLTQRGSGGSGDADAVCSEQETNGFGISTDRAWIEISREALEANVAFFRERLPEDCQLMPAVKADAYGHGAVIVARELNRIGVEAFCVACVQEGIELRRAGIQGEILILGYTHPSWFDALRKYRLSQTVLDVAYANALRQYGKKLHVHIGIDTGMHRLGERCEHIEEICRIFDMPNLVVDGMFTHLSADDTLGEQEQAFTKGQASRFTAVMDALGERGIECPKIHLQASYGVLNYPELAGDYARVGIALYGGLSTGEDTLPWRDELRPVLSLKTRVAAVKEIYAGESAGYGLAFTATQTMRLAVLTIGYADGLPRTLSDGRGEVLIRGQRAPIVGKVCMDQTLVDVSNLADVQPGDVAVVIGCSGGEEITVCDIAEQTGTITNEILSRLGKRPGRMMI
ncbi:MAG: serine racemase VanT catalytic subunit [Acetatifactor sp.]|nr:serine racemase VanT catalytic subunit [Acetatifactor sp.]